MAYEIGTSTSPSDLLDKIRVVAEARGWEITNDSTPSGTTRWLGLRVGTSFFNLLSSTAVGSADDRGGYIYGLQATGYNSLVAWDVQPGSSLVINANSRCKANNLVGPFTSYRIFSGANYIHIVVETSPNVFTHMAFGIVNKYGAYAGGAYMSMSSWNMNTVGSNPNFPNSSSHCYLFDNLAGDNQFKNMPTIFRADIDAKNYFYNSNIVGIPANSVVTGLVRDPHPNAALNAIGTPNNLSLRRTPNSFNQVTPLLNAVLNVSRGSNLFSPVGEIPDLRIINMLRYNAGDILTLGSDEWVILPAKSNTLVWDVAGSAIPSSGNYGYAYKKVA